MEPVLRWTIVTAAPRRGLWRMTNALLVENENTGVRNIRDLDGRVVLVKSLRDQRNPPAGIRGWIEVREIRDGAAELRIAVEFPQMFSTPAHHRTFTLNEEAVERLLASEYNGTFQFTVDDELV